MRIFKASHALVVLLIVTFGLFLASTFGHLGPAPEPGGDMNDVTVTVFTDLPSQPDAPALGMGGFIAGLVIVCALFAFVSSSLAAFAFDPGRCPRGPKPAALLN